MKITGLFRLPLKMTAAALISGGLLALSFPRPDLYPLAWIALIPLFLVMRERPFLSGFLCGTAFFAIVLYWLNIVMVTFGGLHPILSAICYLLLCAYLALYFGAVTWGATILERTSRLPVWLSLPILWVGLEYLRSFALSGFPWALLGYSQQDWLTVLQGADLFGVYGLSFLIVLVNAVFALSLSAARRHAAVPRGALATALILFSALYLYGYLRLSGNPDVRDESIVATLVQGNIDQSLKWDPAFQEETIARYRRLSLQSAGQWKPQLIVWPESAAPFYYQDRGLNAEEVRATARKAKAWLLFGSPAYEKRDDGRWHFLNSAFLLAPDGEIAGRSDKVHLVPFGEYVPMKALLPFVNKLVTGIGDFSPGRLVPLEFDRHRLGVLVCYEGIFPELARSYVNQGSDLLVNITNDAWYGHSSAPYQHLAMARFRAVENRVSLIRAANTGISAFIAPSGTIRDATPIFETLSITETIGLGSRPTLYRRIGDWPARLCLLLTAGLLGRALLGEKKRNRGK